MGQFIDGSHEYKPVLADLENFYDHVDHNIGHLLLMDDFGCSDRTCMYVRSAFYRMVLAYRVQEIYPIPATCVSKGTLEIGRGDMALAQYIPESKRREYALNYAGTVELPFSP